MRPPRLAIALTLILLQGGPIRAQQLDSMQVALDLGAILASEALCGLAYKPDAIRAFIEKRVRPDDLSFPGRLRTSVEGASFQYRNLMSESQRVAHCAQIVRVAKAYGFTD